MTTKPFLDTQPLAWTTTYSSSLQRFTSLNVNGVDLRITEMNIQGNIRGLTTMTVTVILMPGTDSLKIQAVP